MGIEIIIEAESILQVIESAKIANLHIKDLSSVHCNSTTLDQKYL